LAAEITRAARQGIPIVGICGGMQLLGRNMYDPSQIEGSDLMGLGLLDLDTVLQPQKTVAQRTVRWHQGGYVSGYEIHHGRSTPGPALHPFLDDDLGWRQENLWGSYLHGLFENTTFRQHFLTQLGWDGSTVDYPARIDTELDRIAHALEATGIPRRICEA
jgi:adenosylcobyric acid synthase